MALLFIEGFDEYNTTGTSFQAEIFSANANNGCSWVYWDGMNASSLETSTAARTNPSGNGKATAHYNGSYLSMVLPPLTEVIVGFGFYSNTTSGSMCYLSSSLPIAYSNHVANGIRLTKNTDGSISVVNSSTSAVLGTSAAAVLGTNLWDYIEVHYKFGVAGDVKVRVNAVEVISLTGIDTRGSATGINCLSLRGFSGVAWSFFDDLYVCDTTGTINNTFLGPIGVYTLVPNADASVQMTPSSGANYSCVNEIPVNTTNYVTATSLALTDYYGTTNLPAGVNPTSIAGVQINARSVKVEHNNAKLKLGTRSGGTSSFGVAKAVSVSTWVTNSSIFETQPSGSAWDKTSIDNMDIGLLSDS
ncbi:hypothetical protein [Bdellovibrio sp. HCB337]|uniref:hypothetical protein n=1 Tax=Bdellovibrio sp. HCB337 TaxID=3394358 RepID=UPI0039A4F199